MQPTPLRWWTPAQLDAMAQALAPAWGEWLREWLPAAARRHARTACRLAWELGGDNDSRWASLGSAAAGAAWMRWIDEREGAHYAMFACAAGAAAVARTVAREAASDALKRLRDALQLAEGGAASPGSSLFRAWSGAVVITLAADDLTVIELLLDAGTAFALLPASSRAAQVSAGSTRAPLVPAEFACAAQPLRAQVRLADCELDLGTLASLRVGDIIPLPHGLETALDVVVEGQPLCAGYLGRHGDSKAIELAQPSPKEKV